MTEKYLDGVKKTLQEFIADMKNGIFTRPGDIEDLCLVEFALGKMTPQVLMEHIISHVLPYKQHIMKKDIKFFVEKKEKIFAGLPQDRVDYFAKVITKPESQGGMSEENKDIVWNYFDVLLRLSERYKKER